MADGYVLSISKSGAAADDGGAPIRLFEYTLPATDGHDAGNDPLLQLVAEHDEGVDDGDVTLADSTILPFSECLKAEQLARTNHVAAIGDELWTRITPGAVGDALGPVALNSRIHLDLRSPELDRLPWEMLRIGNETPFTKFGARWSLGHPHHGDEAATMSDHPIRIMVLVGNNPEDGLQSAAEVRHIEAAVNRHPTDFLLRTLTNPDSATVEREVRNFRPHVFHFIGHGTMAGGTPNLLVHPHPEKWGAQRLRDIFSPAPPRLVVLNACFAGTSGNEASSLIRAFSDLGSIAVVAMTEQILTDAAAGFTARFYELVLDGKPVDGAATEARRAIRSATGAGADGNLVQLETSWPLVRLTVRGSADCALAKTCAGPNKRNWLTRDFIARWHERHAAWRAIDGSKTRLAVLTGQKESGRRELLNCLADSCARGGDVVLMVELPEEEESGTWQDVIAEIAAAAERHPEITADQLLAIAARDGDRARIMKDFLAELDACSTARRLLVAIDGLGAWSEDLVEDLVADLCSPFCSPGADGSTRLAITLAADDNGDRLDFGLPDDVWRPIEVDEFDEHEWPLGLELFIESLTENEDHRTKIKEHCTSGAAIYGRRAAVLMMGRQSAEILRAQG